MGYRAPLDEHRLLMEILGYGDLSAHPRFAEAGPETTEAVMAEAARLAGMLRGTGVRFVPHGYNSDITIAANLHLTATLEEESLIEYSTSPARLRRELCTGLPEQG